MNISQITKIYISMGITIALQTAMAGNIMDIRVSTLPDQQKVIKIKFDTDITQPTGLSMVHPNRIALDFSHTGLTLPQPILEYTDPLLNQISASTYKNHTRLILGLNKDAQYHTEIHGNEVWAFVNESNDSNPMTVSTQHKASQDTLSTINNQIQPSTTVDFYKSVNNSGIVKLSAPHFLASLKSNNNMIE